LLINSAENERWNDPTCKKIKVKLTKERTDMKLIKLTSLAAVAMLVLGVISAQAQAITNYSKLTVSAVAITNAPSTYNSSTHVYKYTTAKSKFGNKQLLALYADWAGTTWPAGAQLVVCWQGGTNYGDVLVVDKTGTNMLFNANNGVTYGSFQVEFDDYSGAYNEIGVEASPGYDKWTEWMRARFYLYDDDYYYTSMTAYGEDTQNFKQEWDLTDYTKWSDSESANFPRQGVYSFQDNYDVSFSATVKAKGKGLGNNYYWYGPS
jgi:hypothetical protein